MLRRSRIDDEELGEDGVGAGHTLSGLRLLVINDDPHSCELIARLVESLGCRARRVGAPEGVIDFVADPMNEIGGVVIDLRAGVPASVPILTGVRGIDGEAGAIPVVVLTSTADDDGPVWAAGGDLFLARPFHADDFLRDLEAVLMAPAEKLIEQRAARAPG